MKPLAFALCLAAATPALATQPAPSAPADTIDPARLAQAKIAIDHVWPLGTYARMMKGTFDQMMDGMMSSMFDVQASEFVGPLVSGEEQAQVEREFGKRTMRDVMREQDPHFEERMRITNRVMMAEMGPLMSTLEPAMREGLARAYAGKFSVQQLTELNAFFETPTGRIYAAESMLLFTDPEVLKLMGKAAPEMMKAMPAIMQKMQAATAHLPPPPKKEEDGQEEDAGAEVIG